MDDLSAFILAGGKSSRMGRDKAFLRLSGETLLSRALTLAGMITPNVKVAGEAAKFPNLNSVVEDIYPGRGPLGGIHAALVSTNTDLNIIIAVDTPFIERGFLDFLVSEARRSGAVVTVPRTRGHSHPLCGVYRREFAEVAEESLIRGENKVHVLFSRVRTRLIAEEELLRLGFCAEMFRNLNTPREWQEAEVRFN